MIFWLRNTNYSSQLHAIAGRIVHCAVTSKSAIFKIKHKIGRIWDVTISEIFAYDVF